MQRIDSLADQVLSNWWILLVRGVAAIAFGVLALVWPGPALLALVWLFGVYAIADGAMAFWFAIQAAEDKQRWWPFLLEGLVGIGAGVLAFVWPGATALALVYVVGAWAILTGVLEIAAAIELRKVIDNEWLLGLAGALSVVFGVVVAVQPVAGAFSIVWIIGVYALLFGASLIGLALRVRGARSPLTPSGAAA